MDLKDFKIFSLPSPATGYIFEFSENIVRLEMFLIVFSPLLRSRTWQLIWVNNSQLKILPSKNYQLIELFSPCVIQFYVKDVRVRDAVADGIANLCLSQNKAVC